MAELELAAIAHNKVRLVEWQLKLLRRFLQDDFGYCIVDASDQPHATVQLKTLAEAKGVGYLGAPSSAHDEALTFAADHLLESGARWIGLLDHDIFPVRETRLVPKIAPFYGVGQRHAPTGRLYGWPGFWFADRRWLEAEGYAGELNFGGIRGALKADDGDTGSGLWPLFESLDWSTLYRAEHGYRTVREPDGYGLQSFGYEVIDSWIHFSNGSGWMRIPDPEGRERLLYAVLEAL